MQAVIIGATGATGQALVQQLLDNPDYSQVTVFVRRAMSLQHPKLTVEVVDFDQPQMWQDKVRGDVLFSCLGTTLKDAGSKAAQWKIDYQYQYDVANIARQNGVHTLCAGVIGLCGQSLSFLLYANERATRARHHATGLSAIADLPTAVADSPEYRPSRRTLGD